MKRNLPTGCPTSLQRETIKDIVAAMPPAIRFAWRLLCTEYDEELKAAHAAGYITSGRYDSLRRGILSGDYYLGSMPVRFYERLKTLLPVQESDIGVVLAWPTLAECEAYWAEAPEGMKRYMVNPASLIRQHERAA